MVKRLVAIVLLLAVGGCERTPSGPEGNAAIAMDVRFPEGWSPASAVQLVVMTLKVSGPDMEPIWRRRVAFFDAGAADSTGQIHDTVSVPVGPSRTFQVALSDSSGVFLYGETTLDLPRGSAPFFVQMYLDIPAPPIVRIIRTFSFSDNLSFWISSQAQPLGYVTEYVDTGFTLSGADLIVIPQPYVEASYTSKEWDILRTYLEVEHGSVLFLGDASSGGDWAPITHPLGFEFGFQVFDSVQYDTSHRVPLITDFTATGFLGAGDTLLFLDAIRCLSFDTLTAATSTPIARYSSGSYPPSPDTRFGGVAVAALYGTLGGGQFVAVGDIDWIWPATTVVVDSAGNQVVTGLDVKQHRRFGEALLRRLAPRFVFEAP
jgi:hypothetical protein